MARRKKEKAKDPEPVRSESEQYCDCGMDAGEIEMGNDNIVCGFCHKPKR